MGEHVDTARVGSSPPTVVVAGRDDSFVPHLRDALGRRFAVVGTVDAELTRWQRLLTALVTVRPSRRAWVERFYKSGLALSLRSTNARRALARLDRARPPHHPVDVIVQTHALFELRDPRVVLYVDCTHRQSAEQWPDWNPLRGRALRRWYVREERQYRSAAHVFAFSRETRDSLVDHYGVDPDKVSVVGAGLNFERLPEAPSRQAHDTDGTVDDRRTPTILFVGNDFLRKGGRQLLAAFAVVRSVVPEARLRIAGTPHPVPATPGVEVVGRVGSRAEMATLYAGADVFCLPSTFEPYGFVLVEAMAYALPCVATSSCGIPEVVDDGVTGILVPRTHAGAHPAGPPTADVDALAAALVDLLTHPQRARRLGEAGRDRVRRTLRWDHVVDRMAPALSSLAPPPG